MPETLDSVAQQLIDDVANDPTDQDKTALAVKNLKTFAEAKKLLDPEPKPDPEPRGLKAFLKRNEDNLIKGGVTVAVVAFIAVVEAKGDVIFRSKASKFI